uniref:VrlC protein n=1 Tax=uncultured Bacteroidota bacterium TaxID=152509 RepID=A0A1B0Z1R4_9BACT|nr:VrlC protein [uncultured Bacteroidetes bacterium]
MAQKTDLNVAPYYDDFETSDNFVRTLFRPGFAIQARELTQLQSALQNQISQHGSHIFKEGAMVIPGQVAFNNYYHSLKLTSTFAGETIDPSQYFSTTTPVTLTGATTGVTATVIGFDVATTTDQPTLYLRYIASGTDGETLEFADGENLSANYGVTHTTSYSANAVSATTYTSAYSHAASSSRENLEGPDGPASAMGSAVTIESGVYYIRGHFVECSAETLVLEKYSNSPSYRVGFTITETLLAPEDDSSLLDNATGSTNYAAKGAHRLKYTLALAKIARDSTADGNFVELVDTKNGKLLSIVDKTSYELLEETIARRTSDESGDYTTKPFQVFMKETVELNLREGVYTAGDTTDDGNTADSTTLTAEVSMGKAYVKGYEIEKIAPTYKDIKKARDFETVNAGQTLANLGNFVLVNNLYGSPDISAISGENTAYKTIHLYSDFNSTRGSANDSTGNNIIGQARARAIEYSSGTVGQTDAQFKLYLWDIKMFTYLTLSGTPSPTLIVNHTQGVRVEGNTSGAVGYVVNDQITTTGTRLVLIKESGIFTSGEKLLVSDSSETGQIVEDSGNTDLTITSVSGSVETTFTFDQVRSFFMEDTGSTAAQNFTADAVLQPPVRRAREINSVTLDGTDAGGANADSKSGGGETGDSNANTGGTLVEDVLLARLTDSDKNNALEKLPKRVIKTLLTTKNAGLTDTQYTVRRQFIGTTNASGAVAFNASSNETFVALAEKDYVMTILTAGDGTGVAGQPVSIVSTASGAGSVTLTITDSTILGDAAKVKLTATILKTSVSQKIKTTRLMKQVKVNTGATDAYGTRPTDRDISLGRADAFNFVAAYDSQDTSVDAVAPTLTIGTITGAFTRGERIKGGTSGAKGRLITVASPLQYVSTNEIEFTSSEAITGESSGATATISATTDGDAVITSRYIFDTGMRDNFYDISRITRKKGSAAPTGRVLVIYDYLEHGAGDICTVDSYTDIAGRMEYDDIPVYTGSKVDPSEPMPSGQFPLTDTYDYRPAVDNVTGASTTLSDVDEITGRSFDFGSRTFGGTGGTTVDTPKPGSFIQADFEYYLPKMAVLVLSPKGKFRIFEGNSSENPLLPKYPDDAMLIATMTIPPYTFKPFDVEIVREKHQRYTMKDIGKLEDRIDTVEYYTALTLLERNAESFEVTDANGLNRFKSGFMVDNFKGHRVGDTAHRDYKCSMDFEEGELRPQHRSKAIELIEQATTTSERTAAGYQKTGDMITLPYTEEVITSQLYSSRQINCQTGDTVNWIGDIDIGPSSDTWFETEVLPDLVVNQDGDYDAVLARERNNLGTVWNSWQTTWSGVTDTRQQRKTRIVSIQSGGGEAADMTNATQAGSRSIQTVRTDKTRTGVNTQVQLRVDKESQGMRTVSKVAIPFMRSKTITFTGENFKPKTRLYIFFNKTDVKSYVTPASSAYSSDSSPVAGSPLITSATGKVEGSFTIPNPRTAGNPKFPSGEALLTLTSSSTNAEITKNTGLGTAGVVSYSASGLLETQQETIIATRNATVVRGSTKQSTSSSTSRSGKWRWNTIPRPIPARGPTTQDGQTWICTAAYDEGLISNSDLSALRKYGIKMRRSDPYLMRGYDLIGPWYAKFINNNNTGRGFGELAAKYYTNLYQNKPPTLKQKIVLKYIGGNLRPFVRLAGWILTKLKK